jgi:hypothetical protein
MISKDDIPRYKIGDRVRAVEFFTTDDGHKAKAVHAGKLGTICNLYNSRGLYAFATYVRWDGSFGGGINAVYEKALEPYYVTVAYDPSQQADTDDDI